MLTLGVQKLMSVPSLSSVSPMYPCPPLVPRRPTSLPQRAVLCPLLSSSLHTHFARRPYLLALTQADPRLLISGFTV
jgi:hypothetical protein